MWKSDVESVLSSVIEEESDKLCVGCPDAACDTANGVNEWWCSKRGVYPGGKGCIERRRVREALALVVKAAEVLCEERRKEDYFDD